MFASTSTLLALAAFAPSAFAALYTTAPVATTKWTAGQNQTISWQDDGSSPNLASFGDAKVSVYVGNAIQQTQVQAVVASVNVANTSSIVFTPDPSVGQNGNFYFIRFESLALKDAAQPQFPALAFSAKFELDSMTGTFSADEQAQINGASTAPIGGATSAAASATGGSSAATSSAAPASAASSHAASGSATHSSASPSGTAGGNSKSDAMGVVANGFASVLAGVVAAVGVAMF